VRRPPSGAPCAARGRRALRRSGVPAPRRKRRRDGLGFGRRVWEQGLGAGFGRRVGWRTCAQRPRVQGLGRARGLTHAARAAQRAALEALEAQQGAAWGRRLQGGARGRRRGWGAAALGFGRSASGLGGSLNAAGGAQRAPGSGGGARGRAAGGAGGARGRAAGGDGGARRLAQEAAAWPRRLAPRGGGGRAGQVPPPRVLSGHAASFTLY
jgi:hypothetical protein